MFRFRNSLLECTEVTIAQDQYSRTHFVYSFSQFRLSLRTRCIRGLSFSIRSGGWGALPRFKKFDCYLIVGRSGVLVRAQKVQVLFGSRSRGL